MFFSLAFSKYKILILSVVVALLSIIFSVGYFQIQHLKTQLIKTTTELSKQDAQIAVLAKTNQTLESSRQELLSQLETNRREVSELNSQLIELDSKYDSQLSEIHDKSIQQLQETLDAHPATSRAYTDTTLNLLFNDFSELSKLH